MSQLHINYCHQRVTIERISPISDPNTRLSSSSSPNSNSLKYVEFSTSITNQFALNRYGIWNWTSQRDHFVATASESSSKFSPIESYSTQRLETQPWIVRNHPHSRPHRKKKGRRGHDTGLKDETNDTGVLHAWALQLSPNTKELGPKNSGPCLVFPYFMWSTFEPKSKLDPFTFKLGPKLSLRPSVLRLGVSCGIHIKFFGPTIGVHELGWEVF